jgi:hypothetical protein
MQYQYKSYTFFVLYQDSLTLEQKTWIHQTHTQTISKFAREIHLLFLNDYTQYNEDKRYIPICLSFR